MQQICKTVRLLCCLRAPYSVKNYHKTFEASQVTRYHGHFRVDEQVHFDKDPQAVDFFVKQERQLYNQQSSKWKHITEEYYQISSSRRDTRLSSVPQRYDDYQYFTKTNWKNGREYVTVHRRIGSQEELVLDFMKFPYISRYEKTVELLSTSFSPSHSRIAFSVDLRNNEKGVYFIAKTTGNRELIKIGDNARSSRLEDAQDLVFASEDKVYFLKVENHRPCRLFSLNISTGQSSELFHEKDAQFYLGLKLSKDKAYLLLSGVSKTGSKLWAIDLQSKTERVVKLWEGSGKVYINHVKEYFLVWSLNTNSEIRLISDIQMKSLARSKDFVDLSKISGEMLYSSPEEEIVSDIDLLQDNVILYGHRVTLPFIKVIQYQKNSGTFTTKVTDVQMPYQHGIVTPCTNQDYHSQTILFSVSHPFVYEEVYSYSIPQQTCRIVQKYQHTGKPINPEKYNVQMVEVPATDMQTIPLTIIGPTHKRPTKLLLNFYGCYGLPTQITYDNVNIAALQKGWTICYAHIRGGNERGQKWHTQSQGQQRIRSWLDIEQCVGYLLREEYTHPSLLFLSSSSAGAINLWNTISRKPYLYKGAIFRAPFLDVLTCLLDPDQPLSQTDYEEFGNPLTNIKAYHQISSISPYENIGQLQYPLIHITVGLHDYRTPMSQISKFISRFRERATKSRRVEEVGVKGLTTSISDSGSHLGQASIKEQNYRACDVFGYMDYVIQKCSLDVTASKTSS